jgi:hypothetical protein
MIVVAYDSREWSHISYATVCATQIYECRLDLEHSVERFRETLGTQVVEDARVVTKRDDCC